MVDCYKLDNRNKSLYLKLVIAGLIYVLPVILADRYYNDDLARALYGATGWKGDGRPLGEYLILFLCGGKPIADLAPLPLILSVLILSYALVLYSKASLDFFPDERTKVLVLLLVITNPFAMSNLSYKYDCIIMFTALSIPFLVYAMQDTVSKYRLSGVSFAAGVLIMSAYQPALGMCIVLLIIDLFFFVMGVKKQIKGDFIKMAGIAAGAVAYKLIIARHYISKDDWRYNASQTIHGLDSEAFGTVIRNFLNACNYIKKNVAGTPLLEIWGTVVVFSTVAVLCIYLKTDTGKAKGRKIADIVFIIVSPMLVFAATFLPLTVLASLEMRSRIFLSFGGFFLFVGIMMMFFGKKHKILAAWALVFCLFYQYTYMYSYGNALKSQKEYEEYMVYNIAHDLESINGNGDFKTVSIIGNMPRSRQVQMICDKYPFFKEIVPVYFSNDTWIGGAWLYHYMQRDLVIEETTENDLQISDQSDPVFENSIYSCYLNSDKIIIRFWQDS